ncbi:MAG: dTDP-4-dehydrorhamnose 3,5-epimerase [Candidatus Woesebacteria bacterium GW2011_GWB1_41_10]|uniref:dTDP-4-dehydrorhamnose 3,5-epimerase n=1 Tax=Candidatus Woesebacteria bacterium GW2011_GWB1_41_10 TaxID=1618577 RepID=A0A0G0WJ67_9BACT|nr:MAG: dTDP-4-dehydrorhamnose 3,5-epimerase [Candidatus Woesebacteria bacterium GW2011_GWB1_41_10]
MTDFSKQEIIKTSIPGLLIIERPVYADERGFFREVFRLKELEEEIGQKFNIVQANHSHSLPRVIRALHAENWNKLVYPLAGKVFTAIVDIRPPKDWQIRCVLMGINLSIICIWLMLIMTVRTQWLLLGMIRILTSNGL